MKRTGISIAAFLTIAALGGCTTHENKVTVREPPTVVERQTTVIQPAEPETQRQIVVVDPQRSWWDKYHPNEVYDRERATVAHHTFCDEHPADQTCMND